LLSVTGMRGKWCARAAARAGARPHGEPLDFVWEGVRASVVQHETDHLKASCTSIAPTARA